MAITGKEDLGKPEAEITRTGTAEDAAKAWEEAAFAQARRANGLRDKLVSIRDQIQSALDADASAPLDSDQQKP
jgi:hypothetical protein